MDYDYPYAHDMSDVESGITGSPHEAFDQLKNRVRAILCNSPKRLKQVLDSRQRSASYVRAAHGSRAGCALPIRRQRRGPRLRSPGIHDVGQRVQGDGCRGEHPGVPAIHTDTRNTWMFEAVPLGALSLGRVDITRLEHKLIMGRQQ